MIDRIGFCLTRDEAWNRSIVGVVASEVVGFCGEDEP